MHKELKEKAIRLRLEQNLSYNAILQQIPVAKSTLSEWLRHFPLTEEQVRELKRRGWEKGEASRELFRVTMRKKREQKFIKVYDACLAKLANTSHDAFYVAGLALYLAEGSKTNPYKTVLANTDPRIIKFFVKWSAEFMNVPKEKMRAQLHLYQTMDIEKERNFWKNELGFSNSQFYKSYISKNAQGSFTYKESFRHGTCSLYYGGGEKKQELMAAIQAFIDIFLMRA